MAHLTPFSFAVGLGMAALHTGITLWYRLPIAMAAGAMRPDDVVELNRMATEKVAAAARGMVEGQKQIIRLSMAAMKGRLHANDASAVAHASLRPAMRTVKRNASRLPRRRRRRLGKSRH
jgi:hypothetical protein